MEAEASGAAVTQACATTNKTGAGVGEEPCAVGRQTLGKIMIPGDSELATSPLWTSVSSSVNEANNPHFTGPLGDQISNCLERPDLFPDGRFCHCCHS